MWAYYRFFYTYAAGSIYVNELRIVGGLCFLMMFLWKVEVGEVGVLTFLEFERRERVRPGLYILPNLFPFFREIGIVIGYGIGFADKAEGKIPSRVQHYSDQRLSAYRVDVKTDSFIKANLDRNFNLFANHLTTFKDDYGRFQYYRVGRLLFLLTLLATFMCNMLYPSQRGGGLQNFIAQANSVMQNKVAVSVQHQVQQAAELPSKEDFIPTSTRLYSVYINDKRYVKYLDLTPPEDTLRLKVSDSFCAIVPAGKKIAFRSHYPPLYVANMENSVSYTKDSRTMTIQDKVETLFFDWKIPALGLFTINTTWTKMYAQWGSVDKYEGFDAQALPWHQISGAGGGLVCF